MCSIPFCLILNSSLLLYPVFKRPQVLWIWKMKKLCTMLWTFSVSHTWVWGTDRPCCGTIPRNWCFWDRVCPPKSWMWLHLSLPWRWWTLWVPPCEGRVLSASGYSPPGVISLSLSLWRCEISYLIIDWYWLRPTPPCSSPQFTVRRLLSTRQFISSIRVVDLLDTPHRIAHHTTPLIA